MAQPTQAAHAALARNLLSSVLALAFPDNLVTDAATQTEFLQQLPQLKSMLSQHNVFALVTEGKAFDKLQSRLFQLIDTAQGVDRALKAAAFELLLIIVDQCPLETLESIAPQLSERILKMVKYIKDAPRVVAAASELARVLVRHVELFSPETRRELHEWITKLVPASLAVLSELKDRTEALGGAEKIDLYTSVVGVFVALLEVNPSAVRSTQTKLEGVVAALALYTPTIASNQPATHVSAQCLALVANASDKPHQVWKQLVDKAIEMAHQLVDPIAGKRLVSAPLPTGMKVWLRGAEDANASADLSALAVYQRTQALLERLALVVSVLEASLTSRAVSEREVQLVVVDVIALARRVLAVKAQELGKQSAISEDGFRLPLSVVYGALPHVHALGLRGLSAVITRAGICALRHGSKIARTLILAAENVHADGHAALFETVAVCVRALGASTLERLGQPLLEHLVAQCKYDLEEAGQPKKADGADAKPTMATEAKGKNGKGKKRKRQVGDLSQLALGAATNGRLAFLSPRDQRVLVGNVDAALAAIATCVAVYGSLLKSETRAQASDVALLAVQHQAKRRMLPSAPRTTLDSIAMLLLTDTTSADANGAHATNLVKSVDFLSSSRCPSSLVQLVALNVGEALMHPRGPPLSINFDKAIQAHMKPAMGSQGLGSFLGLGAQRKQPVDSGLKTAVAVRGQLDWEKEDAPQSTEVEVETKRVKTIDDGDAQMEETPAEEEPSAEADEEEEEEEDYDDERPASAVAVEEDDEAMEGAPPTTTEPSSAGTAAGDEDDDEFPEIVDGDDEDDE